MQWMEPVFLRPTVKLKGNCNRCGLCCVSFINGTMYRCINLIVRGYVSEPDATTCSVYNARRPEMPILMLDEEGHESPGRHVCCHGSPDEGAIIMHKGFGKGCSLELDTEG